MRQTVHGGRVQRLDGSVGRCSAGTGFERSLPVTARVCASLVLCARSESGRKLSVPVKNAFLPRTPVTLCVLHTLQNIKSLSAS